MKWKIFIFFVVWCNGWLRFVLGKNFCELNLVGMNLCYFVIGWIVFVDLIFGIKNIGCWFGVGEVMDWFEVFQKQLVVWEVVMVELQELCVLKCLWVRLIRVIVFWGSYFLSQLFEDWKCLFVFKDDIVKSI